MSRKSFQEISFPSCQNRDDKVTAFKKPMPIARCVCGFEILVLPDFKAMNRAINKHVAEHKKLGDSSESLTEFLVEQVIIIASKMNPQIAN